MMADIRINDVGLPTATTPAADDFLALDGTTNGTRKILATNVGGATSDGVVSVDDHGAVGDGSTEDTAAINAALAAGDTVRFTAGKTYVTDRIAVPAGKTIIGYGATLKLKAFDGAAANYKSVIDLVHVTKVRIYGLTIDGNRAAHTTTGSITGDEDSGMHGIDIMGGSGHVFVDVTAQNCYGDGIIFVDGNYQFGDNSNTPATHITVTRCLFDNNRRQGCSIVHATDLTFNQCGFTNTNGTLPEYGVDIEPDPLQTHQHNKRLYFNECWFTGNAGRGFGMLLPGQTIEDVVLRNCNVTGNGNDYSIWPDVNDSGILRNFWVIGGTFDKIFRIGQSGAPGSRTAKYENCLIAGQILPADASIQITNTLGDGRNVTIRDIFIKDPTTIEVIRVYDAEGVLIENNTIQGGTRHIRTHAAQADRLTIRDNHFSGASSESIALTGTANDVLIENNRIDKAAVVGAAISWTTGARAIIAGNTITGSAGNWLTTGAGTSALVLGHNEKGGRGETLGGSGTLTATYA